MARNREGLILLLDVGPSMHNVLPEMSRVCSMLVTKKLAHNKYDEVAIVVFGTRDTENELTVEVGGYEHVKVLRKIKVVDGDAIETLQDLPRGTVVGDYLDAIVVGMDMLIKKYQLTNKGKKRLCLITDARHSIKDPYEGTKEDQVRTIAAQMGKLGIKMETIVARERSWEDTDQRIVDENDRLLRLFSEKTCAWIMHVESPTSLLGALKTRNIFPVTVFRGDLEISPQMKIKVWVFKKTSEEKIPRLKKYSENAPPTDKYATHEVRVEYEYKSSEDPSKAVPHDQRIKGYRYGPHVIPISSTQWDAVKFKPQKSVKLLGFTGALNVPRHYYMKDVYSFIPEPRNPRETTAVSALARAMKEMNKVAIVRCVWRQGNASVVLGVLTPNLSEKGKKADSFFFNVLPFVEDFREFLFPSFDNLPATCQPNEKQQEAADNLVLMLDLAPPGKEEALLPEFTPNPILERFYHSLELKSKQSDAAVPPVDPTLKKITEPDPQLLQENSHVIDAFRESFKVKENPKSKKSTRAFDEKEHEPRIGDSTPVQDFEAMMSLRDDPKWIQKAIEGMKNRVYSLLGGSLKGEVYPKALGCLIALRKACICKQEPEQFNDFLWELPKYCQKNKIVGFCEFLPSKGMRLISKSEAKDSEVSDDEARNFLIEKEPTLD